MIRTLLLCIILSLVACQDNTVRKPTPVEGFFERTITQFPLDKEKGIDPESWSDVTKIDGKECRQLLAGKKGQLIIPIWWGKGLRPEAGHNALAKIHFKDTANSPIRVNLFAGLPTEIEVHRIGGLGDNAWKTAYVPVPWDQIMRFKDQEHTAISLYAPQGQDVPVHRIVLSKGNPETDEVRWSAETRAWVARVQAEKRKKASLPEKQNSAATSKDTAVLYARSMVELVYPNSAPQQKDSIGKIHIQLAQNEMEGRQFAVYANGAALNDVSIELGDLKNEAGKTLKATVEVYTVEYSLATSKSDSHPLYPQRLWPHYNVDIPANASHGYWFNVESHRGKTKAGTYNGTLTIRSNGKAVGSAALTVKILPIDLLTMSEAGLHLGGCIPKFIPAHEMKELARYNHNSVNLWYSGTWAGQPIRKVGDDFELDLWIWDDFMKHAKAAGIENFVYFLGGNPYGYPDTMQLERDLYRFAYSDKENIDESRTEWLKKTWAAAKVAPEIRDLYGKWIQKFYGHAEKNGWPEPIVTPFDEPAKWSQENWARGKQYRWLNPNGRWGFGVTMNRNEAKFLADKKAKGLKPEYLCDGSAGPWIKSHFKDCAAIIHKAWPKARIYGSIHHAANGLPFLEDIEVFCTNAIHMDHQLGDKVRAVPNKTFWQYSGTNDKREPVVPWFTFGVYFGSFNARGSLVWAYNWGSRFDTASRGNQWMYGWTTPYSLVRTPYLEGLREGYDERRYMETLKKVAKAKGKEQVADDLLKAIFKEVRLARNDKGRDTVHNFFDQTKDPEKLMKYRQMIVDKILELQQ